MKHWNKPIHGVLLFLGSYLSISIVWGSIWMWIEYQFPKVLSHMPHPTTVFGYIGKALSVIPILSIPIYLISFYVFRKYGFKPTLWIMILYYLLLLFALSVLIYSTRSYWESNS